MKSWKLGLSCAVLATVVFTATAHAVIVCFDYALFRAARYAGFPGYDPAPPGVSAYLSARDLKARLKILGYDLVSGEEALAFSQKIFNTPGFAEEFLRPNDVIIMRDEHVGFVGGIDFATKPATPLIDHYIQIPTELGKPHRPDDLPAHVVLTINGHQVHAGLWQNDPVQEFLHNRTFAQGGSVEVWRRTRAPDANAKQAACAAAGSTTTTNSTASNLVFRLKTAGTTCEVKWTIGQDGQRPKTTCRSALDGPPAPNSAQLPVAADGSGPGATAEASWEGFQNLKWGWKVGVSYATPGPGRGQVQGLRRPVHARHRAAPQGDRPGRGA